MLTNGDSPIEVPEAKLVEISRALAPHLNQNIEKQRRAIAVKWLADLHLVLKAWNDEFIKLLNTYPGFKNSTNPKDYKRFFKDLDAAEARMAQRDEPVLQRLCRPIIRLRQQFPTDFDWLKARHYDVYCNILKLTDDAYRSESTAIHIASQFIRLVFGWDLPDLAPYRYNRFSPENEFLKNHIKYRGEICRRIQDYKQRSAASISDLKHISEEADLNLIPIEDASVSGSPGFTPPSVIISQLNGTPQKQHRALYAVLGFCFGVVFLVAVLVIAIYIPEPKPFQVRTFTTVMAIAAAGVATVMTGLINTEIKLGTQLTIGATGALAVFVVVYMVNPAVLH